MRTEQIQGTYGSGYTDCTIFIDPVDGWYTVEGSQNVNRTSPHALLDGAHVEDLEDSDYFSWSHPIEDLDQFEAALHG